MRPMAVTKVKRDEQAWGVEVFPKDPVSQNSKGSAVVRYRSLRP